MGEVFFREGDNGGGLKAGDNSLAETLNMEVRMYVSSLVHALRTQRFCVVLA